MNGLFDTSDPDDLRQAIEQERDKQIAYATQLCSLLESSDTPRWLVVGLIESFREAGQHERGLRSALKIAVAG